MSIVHTFDSDRDAIINPQDVIEKTEGFPEIFVVTFSYKIMNAILEMGPADTRQAARQRA